MTKDEYQRLRALFDELEVRTAAQRLARLDLEFPDSGDPLRRELVSWLEATDDLPAEEVAAEVAVTAVSGQLVSGRYQIERLLGEGGFARTYLSRDRQLHGKLVVLKSPLPIPQRDREWFERHFEDEVRALAALNHPGVVQVLDSGSDPEFGKFFVLQYIDGPSLRELIGKQGPLEPGRAKSLLGKIALGMAAAHGRGIIHRDLKPENILIRAAGTPEEAPVLIDFGIASVKAPGGERTSVTTRIVGSENYLAPEQAQGHVSPRSDIYALGCIAVELLTGQVLNNELHGRRPELVARQILTASLGKPAGDWIAGLSRLVSLDSAGRPATAAELAPLFAAGRPARRGVLVAIGAAAAALAVPGVWMLRRDTPAPFTLRLRATKKNGETLSLAGGIVTHADQVKLQCSLSYPAYLYLWAQSSSNPGELSLLFPVSAKTPPLNLLTVPPREGDWLEFDDSVEQIQIWVIGSRSPVDPLDSLVAAALSSRGATPVTEPFRKLVEPHAGRPLEKDPDGSFSASGTDPVIARGVLDHRKP